jgi:hypothetical protein
MTASQHIFDRYQKMQVKVQDLNVTGTLTAAGEDITAALAEVATLNGLTASATELNLVDGSLAGQVVASKAVVASSAGTITNTGAHLGINSGLTATDLAGNTVRINSITNTGTANSLIGFQSKPAQGASTAQNVIGCEISPRVNDTFALTGSGSLIGAHIDAYLKGTTGNVAGDVRGAQIELVTDDAATRTVSGDVIGLRMRAAFSGTITGNMIAFSVEKAEAQTNSKQWEALFELTGDNDLIWRDDYTTEVTTLAGAIKVLVNSQERWIPLYSGAPVV